MNVRAVVGLSARSTAQAAACARIGTLTVCGGKKKKAEKRVKEGRKRLGDVIKELQESSTFDRSVLQSRLEEVSLFFDHSCMNRRQCLGELWGSEACLSSERCLLAFHRSTQSCVGNVCHPRARQAALRMSAWKLECWQFHRRQRRHQ